MIKNVNAGIMAFNGDIIEKLINKITRSNSKDEYFLTDIVSIGNDNNLNVDFILTDYEYVVGINDRDQLAFAETLAQNYLRNTIL